MQRLRHYEVPVTINVPLQVALARQNLDRVVVGGVDGAVRVYDLLPVNLSFAWATR